MLYKYICILRRQFKDIFQTKLYFTFVCSRGRNGLLTWPSLWPCVSLVVLQRLLFIYCTLFVNNNVQILCFLCCPFWADLVIAYNRIVDKTINLYKRDNKQKYKCVPYWSSAGSLSCEELNGETIGKQPCNWNVLVVYRYLRRGMTNQ